MFSITHLGAQGWYFSTGKNQILVDPLFMKEFGNGPSRARFPFEVQRNFELGLLPALDALILTHEHEDHFDIASLHQIPRATPIYLSARSSASAFAILKEMGFKKIFPLHGGDQLNFGSLSLKAFCGDHVNQYNLDEWDTLSYLVFDRCGNGSFFNLVDLCARPELKLAVIAALKKKDNHSLRQILSFNEGHHSALRWDAMPDIEGYAQWTNIVAQPKGSKKIKKSLEVPESLLIQPGLTIKMNARKITEVCEASSFLRCLPQAKLDTADIFNINYLARAGRQPILGDASLAKQEWKEIEVHLEHFAQFLYGRRLFKRLFSIDQSYCGGKMPAFAFFLCAQGENRIYEYSPSAGKFSLVKIQREQSQYMAGFECYARDFLGVLRGTFEVRILTRWHSRRWCDAPLLREDIDHSLVRYFHPLNSQAATYKRYLNRYKSLVRKQAPKAERRPHSHEEKFKQNSAHHANA